MGSLQAAGNVCVCIPRTPPGRGGGIRKTKHVDTTCVDHPWPISVQIDLLHVTTKDKLLLGNRPFPAPPYPPLIPRTKPLSLPSPRRSSHPIHHHHHHHPAGHTPSFSRATAQGMASFAVATIPSLAAPAAAKKRSSGGVTYVEGMNAYSGLKGLNKVNMLGVRKTADYSFAKIVASLSPAGKNRRGSAFGAQMNVAGEIFRIAATMNGLVLVGVAVGFVLLRVEAAVEEAE